MHVCLDDCSRLAYAEVLADEQRVTAAGFLRRAVAWFARCGVMAQRVLSDNGSAYRSRLVAAACHALALGHRFTRPAARWRPDPRRCGAVVTVAATARAAMEALAQAEFDILVSDIAMPEKERVRSHSRAAPGQVDRAHRSGGGRDPCEPPRMNEVAEP